MRTTARLASMPLDRSIRRMISSAVVRATCCSGRDPTAAFLAEGASLPVAGCVTGCAV